MKANELMIGDWVNFRPGWISEETGKPEYECGCGFPVKLTCIYDGLSQYDDVLPDGTINTIEVADYELSGIPLTPEILEKNGFRLTKADTVCPSDRYWWAINGTRDGAMIEITIYNPDVHGVKVLTKIHTQSSHESGVNTVHSCDIESVHELQHALRLCGIEKEIIL